MKCLRTENYLPTTSDCMNFGGVARKKINKILNPPAKKSVGMEAPKIDSPIEEINKDSVMRNIEPNL